MRGREKQREKECRLSWPVREAELLSDRHEPSWPFGGPWCHCQRERPGGLVTVATDSWDSGPSWSSYLNPLTSAQHKHFIINSFHLPRPTLAGRFSPSHSFSVFFFFLQTITKFNCHFWVVLNTKKKNKKKILGFWEMLQIRFKCVGMCTNY